jgi:hypothetical protein
MSRLNHFDIDILVIVFHSPGGMLEFLRVSIYENLHGVSQTCEKISELLRVNRISADVPRWVEARRQ